MAGRLKIEHLEWIQESYLEHLWFAWSVAFVLIVHGIFPWIWQFKASEMTSKVEADMNKKGAYCPFSL